MTMYEEIQRIIDEADCLYSETEVELAIDRLAEAVSEHLSGCHPVLLCVLNGGIPFTARLSMKLRFPLQIDCLAAGRYQGDTQGKSMSWLYRSTLSLVGRTVLIADDVFDEGITLETIRNTCIQEGAEAVYTAVLVNKQVNRKTPYLPDFIGLHAENRYLFGYGMDYKGYLRNWPGIFACKTVY